MKNRMTQKDADGIGALILMQKQRAIDYRGAVPNAGMAKRHEAFAETLAKAEAVLFGGGVTCAGCLREGKPDHVCAACVRTPVMSDGFKRRRSK